MLKGKELEQKSKLLAFLLRHDKKYEFDSNGWREIADLIKNHNFTKKELDDIVVWDDKGRYEYNDKKTHLRARQGHSVNVDVQLNKRRPPKTLYHGTTTKALDSIYEKGILKMKRNHVHLTTSLNVAIENGQRFGTPAVITIDTQSMDLDGIDFFVSRNNVWLTDFVDPKYFIETKIDPKVKKKQNEW